jgi:hypothetical protein
MDDDFSQPTLSRQSESEKSEFAEVGNIIMSISLLPKDHLKNSRICASDK